MRCFNYALSACTLVLGFASGVLATPTLQLDIKNGTYDASTQTIVAPAGTNIFTLYAYLLPDSRNTLADTYFISMALTPQYGPNGGSLGTFAYRQDTQAWQTVNVTSGMTYGTPPIETLLGSNANWDAGDLAKHSVFPTYFKEQSFQFVNDGSHKSGVYNTADNAGAGPQSGTGMYSMAFTFDISNLTGPYGLHFDLYNTEVLRGGDIDVTQFAPFSHDAESRSAIPTNVPEPTSVSLLIAGLSFGALAVRLRNNR